MKRGMEYLVCYPKHRLSGLSECHSFLSVSTMLSTGSKVDANQRPAHLNNVKWENHNSLKACRHALR